MDPKEFLKLLKESLAIDTHEIQRPTIVAPMIKVYQSDAPLYEYMSGQNLPVAPMGLDGLYKVIDDLGPRFEEDDVNGAIGDTSEKCADRITVAFCKRDFQTFRVAVEACVEARNVDVPFVAGRDAIPEGGIRTVGDFRDVKLGEAMRQAKDFLIAQGLGNAQSEPESLETLINQSTTPNVIDNAGQSAFEFALIALLAQIGLTTLAHSFVRADADMQFVTHPLVELTMSRRAALPGLEAMYSVTNGVVRFMNIPVFADRNIFIDPDDFMTSIFLVRDGHVAAIEDLDVDREIIINEEVTPDNCDDDCKRLVNYMTGLSRGTAKMGRVINVRPMLVETIVSGLTSQLNNPNAGTLLGQTGTVSA